MLTIEKFSKKIYFLIASTFLLTSCTLDASLFSRLLNAPIFVADELPIVTDQNKNKYELSGGCQTGVTSFTISSPPPAQVVSCVEGEWTAELDLAPNSDGSIQIVTDVKNPKTDKPIVFEVFKDTRSPQVTLITLNNNKNFINTTTLSFLVQDSDSDLYEIAFSEDQTCDSSMNWIRGSSGNIILSSGDGVKDLYYRARDKAGNSTSCIKVSDTTSTAVIILDQTPPLVTGLVDEFLVQPSKSWTWDCDDVNKPCEFRYTIDQNASAPSLDGEFSSVHSASSPLETGTYYLHVQAKDLAGNLSAIKTVSAKVSSTLPGLAMVEEGKLYYNKRTVDLVPRNHALFDQVEVYEASTCSGASTVYDIENGSLQWTFDSDGLKTISYKFKNTETFYMSGCFQTQITIDTVSPILAITNPTLTKGNSSVDFVWTLTYENDQTVNLSVDDIIVTPTGTVACAGKSLTGTDLVWTVTLNDCTGDGTVKIDVVSGTGKDAAGNATLAATGGSVTVDNTPPTIGFTAPVANAQILDISNFTVTGTCSEEGAALTFVPASTSVDVTCTTNTWTANFSWPLADPEELEISVSITDGAGNTASVGRSFLKPQYKVTEIFSGAESFAALRSDGSVVVWGGNNGESNVPAEVADSNSGVVEVLSCGYGFAARKSNGSVITWGENGNSIIPESISPTLKSGVTKLHCSTLNGFAALKSDGSVVTWRGNFGHIFVTSGAVDLFGKKSLIVLKSDGSVIGAGAPSDITAPQSGVIKIFSNVSAYVALKADGRVVAWGEEFSGGVAPPSVTDMNSGVVKIFSTSYAFAALKSDGSVVTWGSEETGGVMSAEVALKVSSNVVDIAATQSAFAALKSDGSVVAWGLDVRGGTIPWEETAKVSSGVKEIFANNVGFAALKIDGSVVSWSNSFNAPAPVTVTNANSDVVKIFSTGDSFAALKSNGSVVTWGNAYAGGAWPGNHTNIIKIVSNSGAFAALKSDGSVSTWGLAYMGGNSSAVATKLAGIKASTVHVAATSTAFAALKSDGSVVTWGDPNAGGDSTAVASDLSSNVKKIVGTESAFAALKANGSVITWGDPSKGGDLGSAASLLQSGVVEIHSNAGAFAALKSNGSVVAWGASSSEDYNGGDITSVHGQLQSGVKKIYSTGRSAFAALKGDGSVVAWGSSSMGGDSSSPSGGTLDSVVEIFANSDAFAALKANGSVVTWGWASSGGNIGSVSGLSSGVIKINRKSGGFAALKDNGSVVVWGQTMSGDPMPVGLTGVAKVFETAAIKGDGTVVTWGSNGDGNIHSPLLVADLASGVVDLIDQAIKKDNGSVIPYGFYATEDLKNALASGVVSLFKSGYATVALKSDGSLVAWGNATYGGNAPTSVTSPNSDVSKIFFNGYGNSFVALKSDGSAVTWGSPSDGGTSTGVLFKD